VSLNPIRDWLDFKKQQVLEAERQRELERLERREDREILRDAILSMARVVDGQSQVFKSFLDSFHVTEPPRVREYDEEADVQRYKARRGALPRELEGLGQLDQFEMLIDKLNAD
jgi:hypothetical protein